MNQRYSARIVPELETGLRDTGLLTSLVTLDSPRFSHYLKKPANLLHDGWTYVESEGSGQAFYRLGKANGTRQELLICRQTRTATVTTVGPKLGRIQRMVYSLAAKKVLENSVVHEFETHQALHAYLFISRREGRLSRVAETIAA